MRATVSCPVDNNADRTAYFKSQVFKSQYFQVYQAIGLRMQGAHCRYEVHLFCKNYNEDEEVATIGILYAKPCNTIILNFERAVDKERS